MKYLAYLLFFVIGVEVYALSPALFVVKANDTTYSGNWTRYSNLANAQNKVNQIDAGTVPLRDFAFHYDSSTKRFYFGTFWSAKDSSGQYTPSNVREGFMQILDTTGSTINNANFAYSGANNETLSIQIQGSNAKTYEYNPDGTHKGPDYYFQHARAGVGTDNSPNSNKGDSGNWLNYSLNMTYDGVKSLDGKTYNYTALNGTLSILFEHTNPNNTALNDFYRIELTTTAENSWAVSENSLELYDTNGFIAIPESSTYSLILGIGVLVSALNCFKRRHH